MKKLNSKELDQVTGGINLGESKTADLAELVAGAEVVAEAKLEGAKIATPSHAGRVQAKPMAAGKSGRSIGDGVAHR